MGVTRAKSEAGPDCVCGKFARPIEGFILIFGAVCHFVENGRDVFCICCVQQSPLAAWFCSCAIHVEIVNSPWLFIAAKKFSKRHSPARLFT